MYKILIPLAAALSLVLLFGCAEIDGSEDETQIDAVEKVRTEMSTAERNNNWHTVDASLQILNKNFKTERSDGTINIYRLDLSTWDAQLINSTEEPKYIKSWAAQMDENDSFIIINGAYFHEDYSPSGYLKINNERVGELIFDQTQSGLLQIHDNQIQIRDLAENPLAEGEDIEYGMQSYPFLIRNSIRDIKQDSGKTARRSAVGVDKYGRFYLIVVDDAHITLYEFMDELISTGIDFVDVLNLDGGTSTGIAVNYNGYEELKDSIVKVPSIVVFKRK